MEQLLEEDCVIEPAQLDAASLGAFAEQFRMTTELSVAADRNESFLLSAPSPLFTADGDESNCDEQLH